MASRDDRRAALVVLALIVAGSLARFALGGGAAPGALGYHTGTDARAVRESVSARASRLARPLGRDEKIDLDRATAEELTRLPRIGPGLSARIVADRDANGPFGALENLSRVSGVGPSVLDAIRRHAAFSGLVGPRAVGGPASVAVNRATEPELVALPGIGPALARAIVEERRLHGPFRTVEDLTRVRGIGPRTVERLRSMVKIP